MTTPEHVDALDLIGYARGELDRDRASQVRAHCFECVECGDQLAAVVLLRRAGAENSDGVRRDLRPAAVAAAVVLVAALSVWMTRSEAVAPAAPASGAEPSVAQPASAAWTELTAEDDLLITTFGRVAIGLGSDAAAVSAGVLDAHDAQLVRAVADALIRGEYGAVNERMQRARSDADGIARVIHGVAGFATGDHAAARAALEPVVTKILADQIPRAEWRIEHEMAALFLARLEGRSGNIAMAAELLDRVADRPSGRRLVRRALDLQTLLVLAPGS